MMHHCVRSLIYAFVQYSQTSNNKNNSVKHVVLKWGGLNSKSQISGDEEKSVQNGIQLIETKQNFYFIFLILLTLSQVNIVV